jgi:Arc/MetJ-type ribon-helix-helix transcriptional regulator
MAAELERVRKNEQRTRSELVREALRLYMRGAARRDVRVHAARLPEEEPTPDELAAINEATAEFREGRHLSLARLRHGFRGIRQQSRTKKS